MKYTQPSFTTPVSNGRITDQQYKVSVGLLCPSCFKKLTKNHDVDNCRIETLSRELTYRLSKTIDSVMGWKA